MSARSLSPDHYSIKKSAQPVSFVCIAPDAHQVHIMGDFNDWHPTAHPMKRQPDGGWSLEIPLTQGQHHYRFRVDGKSMLDPRAQRTDRDHQGEKVSAIAVS